MGLKLADLRNFSRRGRVEGGSVQTKLAELLGAQGARTWPGSFLRSWVPSTRSVSAAAVKMAFSTRKMDQRKRGCLRAQSTQKIPLPLLPVGSSSCLWGHLVFPLLGAVPWTQPSWEAHSSPPSPGLPRAGGSHALEDVCICSPRPRATLHADQEPQRVLSTPIMSPSH